MGHFNRFLLFLFLLNAFLFTRFSQAQTTSIGELEARIDEIYGLPKLKGLIRLTDYYRDIKIKKSIRYGRQSVSLGENIIHVDDTDLKLWDKELLSQAYFSLGEVLFIDANYLEARKNFNLAIQFAEKIGSAKYLESSRDYLNRIQKKIEEGEVKDNFFNRTISELKVGQAINQVGTDFSINAEINLAQAKEKKGEFNEAIDHYKNAINLLKNKGDEEKISELKLRIAVLLDSIEDYSASSSILEEAISEIENQKNLGDTINANLESASEKSKESNLDSLKLTRQKLKELSDEYAEQNNYQKSLEYLQLYQDLTIQMKEDSIRNIEESKRANSQIQLLKQQKQIADLKIKNSAQEKEKQIRIRNLTIGIAAIAAIGLFLILYFYLNKRKQHRKLTLAYEDLDETKKQLETAEKRIVNLLSQQVSRDIATELISNPKEEAGKKHFVCIMFLDVRDFTPMAEKMSPEELIAFQNKLFGFMIEIIDRNYGVINQFVGDGFMATFGAPKSHGNDCQNALNAAKEILEQLAEKNQNKEIPETKVGIGLHAGDVVTGNVGTETRKQFSVTGNPVIIASRIEQLNKKFDSQLIISEEVFEKLDDKILISTDFKEVAVKGRSKPVKILDLV